MKLEGKMRFFIKLLITVCVILVCSQIGKKLPTLAGLIGVMPLTGAIVLIWLYLDNPDNGVLMREYTKGALWGIFPSILFFIAAFICFSKQMPLWAVLCISFGVWLAGAVVDQLLLGK